MSSIKQLAVIVTTDTATIKQTTIIKKQHKLLIMTENKNKKSGNAIGIGSALGVTFGAAYGASTNNVSFSVAMGIIIGAAVGAIFEFVINRK